VSFAFLFRAHWQSRNKAKDTLRANRRWKKTRTKGKYKPKKERVYIYFPFVLFVFFPFGWQLNYERK